MGRCRLGLLVFCAFGSVLLQTAEANAEKESNLAEVRANAGVGVGNVGLAGRVGLSADGWLTQSFGLGVHGAWLGQAAFLTSRSAVLVGPQLVFKNYSSPSGVWIFAASSGYARTVGSVASPCESEENATGGPGTEGKALPLCLLPASRSKSGNTGYASLEVGYRDEGQRFVLGVSLRGDAVGWPSAADHFRQFAGTLNVTWGVKAW